MAFDYDIVFPCARCGKKSTSYLCGKCAREKCPICARMAEKMKDRLGMARLINSADYEWRQTPVGKQPQYGPFIADAVLRWLAE